jgi:hypothetical protein
MTLLGESKIDRLEWAYDYQDFSEIVEVNAYIHRTTGEIVCDDEEATGEPCPVEDIEKNEFNHPLR